MNPDQPTILHHDRWEPALFGMVVLSGLAHVGGLALILFASPHFTLRPHAVTAYVVDLVSADQLAGTNLVAGNKGKVEAPQKVAEAPKPPPPPPPPKPEQVKQPEPPAPKPEPKKEEPKADERAVALAKATQAKPAAPTPSPIVQAKAEAAKPKPEVKPQPAVAPQTAAPPKVAGTPTLTKDQVAAHSRDEQIAKAIAERAKLASKVPQAGTGGGGSGKTGDTAGGPLSMGPGKGPGAGIVTGVEFLVYRNQMETRLKEAWAWADTKTDLTADVRFHIGENGEVSDVRITHSSGNSAYDESVLRAVRAVNPLPPPPESYRKEFADVEYTFNPKTMNQ